MDDRFRQHGPKLPELADIMGGRLHGTVRGSEDSGITGVSSDTRRIETGNLFVAISGERFDGHEFVREAVQAGASASLVSVEWYAQTGNGGSVNGVQIVVPDVIAALQKFAFWYRNQFELPVIAVTGSSGKTTTKDMISAVLGKRYQVFKTLGNLNSQLGVSEGLFSLAQDHNIAVIELGMTQAGELDRLAKLVRPSVGVITNVGAAHIEYFDSIEGIARAKGEILDHLPPDGSAILNADDPLVMAESGRSKAQLITFGRSRDADIRLIASETETSGSSFSLSDGSQFRINLMGEHQIMNALVAVTAGRLFGIDDESIACALEEMTPTTMRMEIKEIGRVRLINDTYNANPSSMEAALKALALNCGRKLAILGDMLELGDHSVKAHREIGKQAAGVVNLIITVGEHAREIADAALVEGMSATQVFACSSNDEAISTALERIRDGDMILVKGSRGMKMETIVDSIDLKFRERKNG